MGPLFDNAGMAPHRGDVVSRESRAELPRRLAGGRSGARRPGWVPRRGSPADCSRASLLYLGFRWLRSPIGWLGLGLLISIVSLAALARVQFCENGGLARLRSRQLVRYFGPPLARAHETGCWRGLSTGRFLITVSVLMEGTLAESRSCCRRRCSGRSRQKCSTTTSRLTNRVQGHPGGGCKGRRPLPAGGLAVENCLKEIVSKPRTTCRMPPHQPAGIAKQALSDVRESSTLVPQRGHPLCTTVPHRSGLRRQGGLPP